MAKGNQQSPHKDVTIEQIRARTAITTALITAVVGIGGTYLTLTLTQREKIAAAENATATAQSMVRRAQADADSTTANSDAQLEVKYQKAIAEIGRLREEMAKMEVNALSMRSTNGAVKSGSPKIDEMLIPYYEHRLNEVPRGQLRFTVRKTIPLPTKNFSPSIAGGEFTSSDSDKIFEDAGRVAWIYVRPNVPRPIIPGTMFTNSDYLSDEIQSPAEPTGQSSWQVRGELRDLIACGDFSILLSSEPQIIAKAESAEAANWGAYEAMKKLKATRTGGGAKVKDLVNVLGDAVYVELLKAP